jgi:hypothetical protein
MVEVMVAGVAGVTAAVAATVVVAEAAGAEAEVSTGAAYGSRG